MVKISIIVPIYNAMDFLDQCLNCIINQTMTEIEIICVNDGSTDMSVEIIKKFQVKDSRIKLIEQDNAGGGVARNRGMQEARGEYLLFLDADDFFEPDLCDRVYRRAVEKSADIVIFKADQFDMRIGEYLPLDYVCYSEHFDKEVFSYKNNPDRIFNSFHNCPWNKLFLHDFVKKNHIKFQNLHRTNDLLFTCSSLILAKRITILDAILVHYRVGYSGNCQTTNHEYPLDFYYAFKALKDMLINCEVYEEVNRSFINWAMEGCVYNVQSIGTFNAFKECYSFLKREGFHSLNIELRDKAFYYYPERYDALQNMLKMDCEEYLFNCLKEAEKKISEDQKQRCERERELRDAWRQERKKEEELDGVLEELKDVEKRYQQSVSYRLGRAITALPRWCRDALWKRK